MSRRSRKPRYTTDISEPEGSEWFVIEDIRLWLPQRERTRFKGVHSTTETVQNYGPGWAVARSALDFILGCLYPQKPAYRVDWLTKVGEGLSKETYRADVLFMGTSKERDEAFAVSQIHFAADEGAGKRLITEMGLLDTINSQPRHFGVPKPIGMIWYEGLLISVTSFIAGLPVTFKTPHVRPPWEIVGTIAADLHQLPIYDLPTNLRQCPTRRHHALSVTEAFVKYDAIEIQDTLQWISENLPPEEPPVLVHSDLLGQNILQTPDDELYLIDWEYAFVGDPAYDLAIVTRGVKKPFQVSGGLDRLLDAYRSSGGLNVSKKDVHLYALLLCLGWYDQSLDRSQGGHAPDYYLSQLKNLLRRVDQL